MRFSVDGNSGPHGPGPVDIDRRLGARAAAQEETAVVGPAADVAGETRAQPGPAASAADGGRRRADVRVGRTAAAAAARGHLAEARVAEERQVPPERQGEAAGEQFQRRRGRAQQRL